MNVEKSKEVEMISGTVNVTKTKKMLLCSYYPQTNKTSEEYMYLARAKEEFIDLEKKYKNAIYITGWDFNLPGIDWKRSTVTNNFYPLTKSKPDLHVLGHRSRTRTGTDGRFPHQTREHIKPGIHKSLRIQQGFH